VVTNIKFKIPKEPVDIREFIRNIRKGLSDSSDINYDSLAVWAFNKFPKYLWEAWESELRANSYTWQKFLRILKLHTNDVVMWALTGELSWEALIKRIISTLKRYSGR